MMVMSLEHGCGCETVVVREQRLYDVEQKPERKLAKEAEMWASREATPLNNNTGLVTPRIMRTSSGVCIVRPYAQRRKTYVRTRRGYGIWSWAAITMPYDT